MMFTHRCVRIQLIRVIRHLQQPNDEVRKMEGVVRFRALTRRQVLKASAGAPLVIAAASASAQAAYPARPVKVVIPYPPAGGADTVGRLLFQKLGEMWGAQFVIDNRGGAGGSIAAAAVAKAERDGRSTPICLTTRSRTSN